MLEKILRKFGYIKILSFDEALNLYKKEHFERYNFIHPITNKKIGKGITPGDFTGFRLTYEIFTKNKCPINFISELK